jgi:hypothetical protein
MNMKMKIRLLLIKTKYICPDRSSYDNQRRNEDVVSSYAQGRWNDLKWKEWRMKKKKKKKFTKHRTTSFLLIMFENIKSGRLNFLNTYRVLILG